MSNPDVIERIVNRKIDEYHTKFLSPTPATIKRWRREEALKMAGKDQLALPFVFPDEPSQLALLPVEDHDE